MNNVKVGDRVQVVGDIFPNVVGTVINVREERVDIEFEICYTVQGITAKRKEKVSLPKANVYKL